jgi:outer membrane protein assembly factor BamB
VSADGVTTVYAAGGWSVYAVDGADGSMLWSQTPFAPYGIQGTPAVAGGVAYVIDAQPVLHAYDAVTGNEIWATEPLGSGIAAPSYPVVDGGRIFVARSNEQLFAIDAATGQVLWEQMVFAASQPSAANGIVYIHWRKGYQSRLAALDEATGDVLWETVLGSSSVYTFGAGASIANGVVYSMSLAGGVVAMDAVTGEKLWRFSMSPGAGAMPAVVDGTVYAAAGKLLKFGLEGGRPG